MFDIHELWYIEVQIQVIMERLEDLQFKNKNLIFATKLQNFINLFYLQQFLSSFF